MQVTSSIDLFLSICDCLTKVGNVASVTATTVREAQQDVKQLQANHEETD